MEGNEQNLSVRCKSTVLLHLVKINDLAHIFSEERRGFHLL
jgi:hypothetical protein